MSLGRGGSRDAGSSERAAALATLVEEQLPQELTATNDHDAWPLIGAALLSRATATLRHVVTVAASGQDTDAATLARSLYEHIVHVAWLGAEPNAARIEEWRKHDLNQRLKADQDVRDAGGELMTSAKRAAMERQVAGMTGNELRLVNLTVAADKHWAGKLPGLGTHRELTSFRGLYAVLYRYYSGTAHPSYIGINPVVEDIGPTRKRVTLEPRSTARRRPPGLAAAVYGLGLCVAAQTLGWPDQAAVMRVFERWPVTRER